jgi:Flp pilus assembly protein TadG
MKRKETGATMVEFALVLPLFLTFLLGVLELSRMLYTWNAANEATREGARYAVVCADPASKDRVVARMRLLMPQLDATKVNVDWQPAKCDATNCEGVTVSLTGTNFTWITPIVGAAIGSTFTMPAFSTYLQRELMSYNDKIC